jgi:hypothetical protein
VENARANPRQTGTSMTRAWTGRSSRGQPASPADKNAEANPSGSAGVLAGMNAVSLKKAPDTTTLNLYMPILD